MVRFVDRWSTRRVMFACSATIRFATSWTASRRTVMPAPAPGRRLSWSSPNGPFAGTGQFISAEIRHRGPDGRLELAVAPGVGRRSPGAGSRFSVRGSHRLALPARRGLADGHGCAPVVAAASGDDARPVEFAGMIGMRDLFLEQRAAVGGEENEVTLVFKERAQGWCRGWLTPARGRRGSICRPTRRRRIRVDARALAAVQRTDLADDELEPSFEGDSSGEREARRGLRREPDSGDGDRGGLR